MRLFAALLGLWTSSWSVAQFDLGGSVGMSRSFFHGRENVESAWANFSDAGYPNWTAAIFYRERKGAYTDLGIELQWARREFHAWYGSGTPENSAGTDAHFVLDMLYLGITPEVRMGPSGHAVVRFGPQVGFRVGGSMTGRRYEGYPDNLTSSTFEGEEPSDFGAQLAFMGGLGFRIPAGERHYLVIDLFSSVGLTSLLLVEPGSRNADFGIRLGWSRRVSKGSITGSFGRRSQNALPVEGDRRRL